MSSGEEEGTIALAFHPEYGKNGYFYISYASRSPDLVAVISRFAASTTDPNSADLDSELVLLEVSQPIYNHNVDRLAFGPDGGLVLARLGDCP